MIELLFIIGGNYRKVTIKGRRLLFTSSLTYNQPITLDLDKIDYEDKKFKDWKEVIEELKDLHTEEDIANDIIKDFQKTGWILKNKEVKE